MRIKNRIYALAVTAGMIVGAFGVNVLGVPGNNGDIEYTDVNKDDWYYQYVKFLSEKNVVNGVTETEFMPSGTFTVAQSAAVITRYLGLEDMAAERLSAMKLLGVKGSDKWYAGYIQLMHEAGIMDVTEYGCSVNGKSVSIDDASRVEAPVNRYEFAAFVTRSFELDGTEIKIPSGDGSGNEFIHGGFYDESKLELYIPYVKDYNDIPSSYEYYVLKAYYNGIFNGDNNGNFNPMNNLTRGEMAKIVSVILDKSQRVRIDPEINQNDVAESENKTAKPLDDGYADEYLLKAASSVVLYTDKDKMYLLYQIKDALPDGYILEVRQYRKRSSGLDTVVNSKSLNSVNSFINCDFEKGDKLVFLVKDAYNGSIADAYILTLNSTDNISHNSLRYAR